MNEEQLKEFNKHFQYLSSFAKDLENDKELVLREAGAKDIFCKGIALATKPKRWIKSTEETPDDSRPIHISFEDCPLKIIGYYNPDEDLFSDYLEIYEPSNDLYWQYVDLPTPVEKEKTNEYD